jgi:hypothetical protein
MLLNPIITWVDFEFVPGLLFNHPPGDGGLLFSLLVDRLVSLLVKLLVGLLVVLLVSLLVGLLVGLLVNLLVSLHKTAILISVVMVLARLLGLVGSIYINRRPQFDSVHGIRNLYSKCVWQNA